MTQAIADLLSESISNGAWIIAIAIIIHAIGILKIGGKRGE